ncbi:MAG TPA: lipopolysaccharide heptosyltransferase II [Ktedonobacteraceae bacterium]|nr:lipopolysaccharide heptosyltransferase II [Ktedonobacteraceae bacterium]
MSTFESNNRDEFGYPLPPSSRMKLRKEGIRTSKRILRTAIYLVMSLIGFFLWLGRVGKAQPALTPRTIQPKRILVIRLDLIGDLVLSLSVAHTLKRAYPDAEIDLLAVPSSSKVALSDPNLAQVIAYDPNVWRRPKALLQPQIWREAMAVVRRLRSRRYDIAISVFGDWAAILSVLSAAKRRVGFGRESYPGFMTDNVPGKHWDEGDHQHEVDYCLELAKAAGATVTQDDRVPQLYVNEQARTEIEQLLLDEGILPGMPLIVCHVSSNNGQSKRWPIPYWATLIDRLRRENVAQVVFSGAPDDLPLVESVTSRMHEHAVNLAGKTSLTQLAALMERADLLVTGDSGPMHIATAVGTSLIAIHGPTDPALSGPVSPYATILRSDIWCSPCYEAKNTADCRFFTTQCMKNITPDQVFNVVQKKLIHTYV